MRILSSYRRLILVAALAIAALPCFGGEVAVLRNGFSIRHERREIVGDVTRLYVNHDGSSFVDVPTAEIEHFEAAPDEPPSSPRLSASTKKLVPTPAPFLRAAQPGPAALHLDDVVNSASGRYRLDPDLVNSVIKAESGFNVRAVSPKGAQGLMQLMPGTASSLGVSNAFDPEANVEGGTKYLRELLERYNFDLVKALAAYNAGPQRVEQFGGVPPYYETRAYVAKVVRDFNKKKAAQGKTSAAQPSAAKAHSTPAPSHSSPAVSSAKTAAAAGQRVTQKQQAHQQVVAQFEVPPRRCHPERPRFHQRAEGSRAHQGVRRCPISRASFAREVGFSTERNRRDLPLTGQPRQPNCNIPTLIDPFPALIYLGCYRLPLRAPAACGAELFPFMDKKRILASVVVFLLLAVLIYLQYRHWRTFDWGTFWSQTHRIRKIHVLHGIALIYLGYGMRAWRWKIFL